MPPTGRATPSGTEATVTRRAETERFVGFAFASGELLVEANADGIVTFAAGAFRSKFGQAPEAFVGRPVHELISPIDHDALDNGLWLMQENGRMPPLMLRLANPERTSLALAGLAMPLPGEGKRLFLSFAVPPVPHGSLRRPKTNADFARAAEARMRSQPPCDLSLLEIVGAPGASPDASAAVDRVLAEAAPNALAQQIAPGRFSILDSARSEADLLAIVHQVEDALRRNGMEAGVTAERLPLTDDGLNPVQAARAIRQALAVFARDGAKGLGVCGFGSGLSGYLQHANTHARHLRRVIQEGDFTLAFQPIVSLADGTTHHHEALIRPNRIAGLPTVPQEFIVLVETLGLAEELDFVVAGLACRAAEVSRRVVAFNLSGHSVQSPAFRTRLLDMLAVNKARAAGLLMIEMTETAEIEDPSEAARTAAALREIGVPFCLDDFGAGAADLRLLRALSPDLVKLDGSYVAGITAGGRERALVAGMVEMARGAGAKIVAERIETKAEAHILRQLGVQYGQGWLYGRPGPLAPA